MTEAVTVKTAPVAATSTSTVIYAGFGRRFLAVLIDAILIGVAQQIIMIPFNLIIGATTASMRDTANPAQIMAIFGASGMVFIISLVIQALYYGGMLVYKNGQTIGKMALGVRVVSVDGKKISWGKALLREIVGKFVSSLVLLLGFLWVLWDPKKQAWHDKIANTYVVRV